MFAKPWQRDHGEQVATNIFHHRDRRLSGGCRVISNLFLFAWQVMADGDRSASAFQARSFSVYKHICQWLLSKVLANCICSL